MASPISSTVAVSGSNSPVSSPSYMTHDAVREREDLVVGGTFFVFSDYMRPAVRLAALSRAHVIYSWTHDSVGLGEDGPTHQPVEHLASLRAMPGLRVIRPADANETAQAWRVAVDADGPTALVLSRQDLPVLEATAERAAPEVARGGYVLVDPTGGGPTSSSSAPAARSTSAATRPRCWPGGASGPGWCRSRAGSGSRPSPRSTAGPCCPRCPALAVEAGASFGWDRYADDTVSIDTFGASAPGTVALGTSGSPPTTWPTGRSDWSRPGAEGGHRPGSGPAEGRRCRSTPDTHHERRGLMTRLHDLYQPGRPEPVARQPPAGLAGRAAGWPSWSTRASGA